jgi:hypothetical protein
MRSRLHLIGNDRLCVYAYFHKLAFVELSQPEKGREITGRTPHRGEGNQNNTLAGTKSETGLHFSNTKCVGSMTRRF